MRVLRAFAPLVICSVCVLSFDQLKCVFFFKSIKLVASFLNLWIQFLNQFPSVCVISVWTWTQRNLVCSTSPPRHAALSATTSRLAKKAVPASCLFVHLCLFVCVCVRPSTSLPRLLSSPALVVVANSVSLATLHVYDLTTDPWPITVNSVCLGIKFFILAGDNNRLPFLFHSHCLPPLDSSGNTLVFLCLLGVAHQSVILSVSSLSHCYPPLHFGVYTFSWL